MSPEDLAIAETINWINTVVIGCNFCPFAAREMKAGKVRYVVSDSTDPAIVLQSLLDECRKLDEDPAIETSLLILTGGFKKFRDYLDLTELADGLIETEDYEGVYQVASFHPEYRFAGALAKDPANYTNRSIYPMLHLLREESITRALKNFPDPGSIPERNIAVATKKGLSAMEALRESCRLPVTE